MRCPSCGGNSFRIEGGEYVCQTVHFTPASTFIVPPGVPGNPTAGAFQSYRPEVSRPCQGVWTKEVVENSQRAFLYSQQQEVEREKLRVEISQLNHPVERLLRAVAFFGTVRDQKHSDQRFATPQMDFGSNHVQYMMLSGTVSVSTKPSDEAIARWFAQKARSIGVAPDETVRWPEEKKPLFRQPRYGEPVKVRPGAPTAAWRVPAQLLAGRESFLRRDIFLASDGRISAAEGWPAQYFGEPALVWLAGRLGYPVTWQSTLVPPPKPPTA